MGKSLQEELLRNGIVLPPAPAEETVSVAPQVATPVPEAVTPGGASYSPPASAPVSGQPADPGAIIHQIAKSNEGNSDLLAMNMPRERRPMMDAGVQLGNAGFKDVGPIADIPKPPPPGPTVGYPPKTEAAPAGAAPPAAKPTLQQQLAGGGGPSSYEKLLRQQQGEDMATYRRQHELGLQQQRLAHEHAAGETIYRDQAADRADKQAGELNGAEAEYRAAVDDFKKDKIDEDHFWKNRNAGQKAAGFLAAAFGGFLQGFNHLASNPALDQMNHAIDRDIMVQRANHEDKRAAADAQKGMYGMMLDRFHNANVAADMAHAGYLEVIRAKGDEMAAKQNDEGARDAWMAQRQRIDQQIETTRQRAAAAAAAAQAAQLDRAMKIEKEIADINHTNAETAKLGSEVGAGPKLSDEQKAQREVTANVAGIEANKPRAGELTRGTAIGGALSHLPGFLPGVLDARAAVNDRGDYNNRVKTGVAAAYKLSTDANEPKNLEMIQTYAEPYELNANDDEASAKLKMAKLQQLLIDSGRAKGATDNPLQASLAGGGGPPGPSAFPGFQKGAGR